MIVQHNMVAANNNRLLNSNVKIGMSSTEKLASGYRINRAADDAAGLSISEEMRSQIRGLNQGSLNSAQGENFLQVADGALNEVHNMLHRIRELAIQASNDTNVAADREAIDIEVQAIKDEIDKIGAETEYNTIPVFRGEMTQYKTFVPSATGLFFQLMGSDVSNTGYMEEPLTGSYLASIPHTDSTMNTSAGAKPYVGVHLDFSNLIDKNNQIQNLVGTEFYVNCCTKCCPCKVTFTDGNGITKKGSSVSGLEVSVGIHDKFGNQYSSAADFCQAFVDAGTFLHHVEIAHDGGTLYFFDTDNNAWSDASKKQAYFCDIPGSSSTTIDNVSVGLWIQTGANALQGFEIYTGDLSTAVLNIPTSNCLTRENAQDTLERIDFSIEYVSSLRSKIGAQYNRLEHAIAVDDLSSENLQNAESKIRDVDMAKEMVKYSANQILIQAEQSMLAQANQATQGILQILR
ncbi:MAG TPA: hypothetical protein DDY31_19680 [Lachnospiraceae bacterium]|nr:hypothetical protein [Lachnospiraceae bacterium]